MQHSRRLDPDTDIRAPFPASLFQPFDQEDLTADSGLAEVPAERRGADRARSPAPIALPNPRSMGGFGG